MKVWQVLRIKKMLKKIQRVKATIV
jgi:hypothetical protein